MTISNTLTATVVSCGGQVTGSSGWITSPDEDNDGWYDFNTNCHWTIEVDPSKVISFQIMYVWADPYQKHAAFFVPKSGAIESRHDKRKECKDRLEVISKYFNILNGS